MKTLYYFRHSTKDGVGNTIGPKGLELAVTVGEWFEGEILEFELEPNRVFHGPLVRTAQTALAFLSGTSYTPVVMPVIQEIGDDELFKQMTAPSQFRALAGEMGNYRAISECHSRVQISFWQKEAFAGVVYMFDQMEDGETAVAFGHSPMIELAISVINGNEDLPKEYLSFGDVEGVEIQAGGFGIQVVRKVSMPTQFTV